jgi:hypothetical protein
MAGVADVKKKRVSTEKTALLDSLVIELRIGRGMSQEMQRVILDRLDRSRFLRVLATRVQQELCACKLDDIQAQVRR